jgi:hypothetical protein
VARDEESPYSVNDLTRDLDELAGRFRRRFATDGGGDTGKAAEFLTSVSEAGNLIADLDDLAQRLKAPGQLSGEDGDTGKDIGARTEARRLFDEIDHFADDFRRKFPSGPGDMGKGYQAIDNFFEDLDSLAGAHRGRLTRPADGGGGDTGKDREFRVSRVNVGRLVEDLDLLAERYRDRLADGGGGDTGK